ncbi:MAG: YdiU family protein [Hyphomonadaceae bacterium]|nr:YdiU family protein [Hyphomonadaceae bacterium]
MAYPPILEISDLISDSVEPADFPAARLRFRNQRWAERVGLGDLSASDWIGHFARFAPLAGNLPGPLALRYHGHQFGTYNPQLGDGRGFLFAQLQGPTGRILDLGTKGSGQTPWSRQGDGRLTLKGAVREILASSYLEALGVNTSKTISVIETGEELYRGDEPSPTRSAVMVRLQHSHIRFGSFQRLAWLEDADGMARLLEHCVATYHPQAVGEDPAEMALGFLSAVSEATARMVAQWMAAGFVHGVMNTDNFNITGESFDFGPYRFLPVSDPNFTAAYFDQTGLYRFGRQPTQAAWALQQLASALLLLAETEDLVTALGSFQDVYQRSFARHTLFLLGLKDGASLEADLTFLQSFYGWMTASGASWAQTFFDWFGGAASADRAGASPQAELYAASDFAPVRTELFARQPDRPERLDHAYFQKPRPVSLVIDEIEALWAPIAEADDWSLFEAKLAAIEDVGRAIRTIPDTAA